MNIIVYILLSRCLMNMSDKCIMSTFVSSVIDAIVSTVVALLSVVAGIVNSKVFVTWAVTLHDDVPCLTTAHKEDSSGKSLKLCSYLSS